jgi:hypothetical protein
MEPVLIIEGELQQIKMYTPSQQCVKANGVGAGTSNNGKLTNKSVVR